MRKPFILGRLFFMDILKFKLAYAIIGYSLRMLTIYRGGIRMSAVEFKDVVKIYGKGKGKQVAVDHVSFTIEKGEFVVIL